MRRGRVTDAVLNINKPAGCSSHDVVATVRRLVGDRRAGHTGTLDPSATGVLPVCVGRATRIARYLLHAEKAYRVVMRLGEVTDTQDATGRVIRSHLPVQVDRRALAEALRAFEGAIEQTPPMYSALKVGGVRLYELARRGLTVPRAARTVTIREIRLLAPGPEINDRDVTFEIVCSSGTYIRTLCADLGERLGCGAHLLRLERRRAGPFRIEEALMLEALAQAADEGRLEKAGRSLDEALAELPVLRVDWRTGERIRHGGRFEDVREAVAPGGAARVHDPAGRLLAVARAVGGRQFQVERVVWEGDV